MQPEDPNHGGESGSPREDRMRTGNGRTGPSRTSGPQGELNFSVLVGRLRDTLRRRDERSWSVMAHLSVLLWLVIGPIGGLLSAVPWLILGPVGGLFFATVAVVLLPAAPLILWLVYKDRFPTVRFHAAQAFWYQVACIAILGVGWFITVRAGSSAIGYLLVPVMSLATFVPLVYGCYAAYKVSQSFGHRYPVVADMVDRGAPTTSRFPTGHPFFSPRPADARQEVLAGALAAVSVAGTLVVLVYVILGVAGAFDNPLFPFNLGLAIFSLIHGGAVSGNISQIPGLFGGGYLRVGLPATWLALLPFVAMLILGRILARRIGATILFVGAAALAYAALVCISAALGAVSVSEVGVTVSVGPGPFSAAAHAFLWAGLGVLIGAARVNGPPLPQRARRVIRGAFTAVGVSFAISVLLAVILTLAPLLPEVVEEATKNEEPAKKQEATKKEEPKKQEPPKQEPPKKQEAPKKDEFTPDEAGVVGLILFTPLPNVLGTSWLFVHGLSFGLQGVPDIRGIPMIGQFLEPRDITELTGVPLKVGLLGAWPFGGTEVAPV